MPGIVLDNEPHFSRLHVTAVASQVENLFELRNPTGAVLYGINGSGSVSIPTGTFTAPDAATTPLVVKGFAAQTADLIQAKDSTNTTLLSVGASGRALYKVGASANFFTVNGKFGIDYQTVTDPGDTERGFSAWMEASAATTLSRVWRGADLFLTIPAGDARLYTGGLTGTNIQCRHRGDGTLDNTTGITISVGKQTGSGSLTTAVGLEVTVGTLSGGSGAITNGYGLYVHDAASAGTATLTNQYGLYIENQTKGATLKYSIFSLGGTAQFATGADANVGLIVRGNSGGQSGALQQWQTSTPTTVLSVAAAGHLTFGEAVNVVFGTTTGTQIGTVGGAAGQKIGWWGATPAVQPLFATGTGKTVDQLIGQLQTMGLLRQS